ncbi:MAG: LL-diaminopimelate aminotransferase [Deltaproteobacteria bacterium]|nr:LL-diaminopimelate aminotransferase [Deltaproteobacteria bacterium]
MNFKLAARIGAIPPYLFAHIDALKLEERAKGKDLIDLGIGDPDLPTPPHIVAAMQEATADAGTHRYPAYVGLAEFRAAAARFLTRRFGVKVDPEREVVTLIGSKEGIAHFPVAFVDPGDVVLVPDPGYPVYATLTRFMGGEVFALPLRREHGFLPDLAAIPERVARRAKIMWLNYPNNPTAALAPPEFYRQVVEFALRYDIIVASDNAYSEMWFETPAGSFLQTPGAMECGLEFHSLSKTYNMTGWRVGFAVGHAALVAALLQVKTNVDSGCFEAVQRAGVAALDGDQACVDELRRIYRERRDVFCAGLARAGYDVIKPPATFYVLLATKGMPALEFTMRLLREAGVVATPATGFGAGGEGFVRFALTAPVARLREAVARLERLRL